VFHKVKFVFLGFDLSYKKAHRTIFIKLLLCFALLSFLEEIRISELFWDHSRCALFWPFRSSTIAFLAME